MRYDSEENLKKKKSGGSQLGSWRLEWRRIMCVYERNGQLFRVYLSIQLRFPFLVRNAMHRTYALYESTLVIVYKSLRLASGAPDRLIPA
jgi:hypothetical protein